jgi:hypothetical protein
MPRVGFELTISAFKRAKIVHALDRAATVINLLYIYIYIYTTGTEFVERVRAHAHAKRNALDAKDLWESGETSLVSLLLQRVALSA